MSGVMLDTGSVMSFVPADGWNAVYVGQGDSLVRPVVGFAAGRPSPGWTVHTEMCAVFAGEMGGLAVADGDWELVRVGEGSL